MNREKNPLVAVLGHYRFNNKKPFCHLNAQGRHGRGLWTLDFKVGCQSAWHYQVFASKYFLFASWIGRKFSSLRRIPWPQRGKRHTAPQGVQFPLPKQGTHLYRPIKDEWLCCPWAGYLGSYTGGKQFRRISHSLWLEHRSSGIEAEAEHPIH